MSDGNKTIAASDLHNCAAVLYVQAGRAEKRGHHARAEWLMRGFEFLSDLAGREYETVTVPRELLRDVLKIASEDNDEHEAKAVSVFAVETCQQHRARINELRRIAGMEEDHD